jgi:hypothetical protein
MTSFDTALRELIWQLAEPGERVRITIDVEANYGFTLSVKPKKPLSRKRPRDRMVLPGPTQTDDKGIPLWLNRDDDEPTRDPGGTP